MHLLVPATEPDPELCKGLLSAKLLGYPIPTLINWQKRYTSETLRANGSHIAKITGALDYIKTIDKLDENSHDHLILMIDGYDLWFQLPPSVLYRRYRNIGQQLYNWTRDTLGASAVEAEHISQSVIFPAEKNCAPFKKQRTEIGCYGMPEPPLREDLYGESTDTRDIDKETAVSMRPAFINAGFVLGDVGSMKALMQRSQEKADEDEDHLGSDQYIFNEVFGQQQFWRELQRQRHRSGLREALDGFQWMMGTAPALMTDPHPFHEPANVTTSNGLWEFGIGLDYNLELSQTAVHSEFEGRFLTYGDPKSVEEILSGPDTPKPIRVQGLPADIAEDAAGAEWLNRPLYTNVHHGSVPMTIHMNGFKEMRQAIWGSMWFFKNAREMLHHRGDQGRRIARSPDGEFLMWADVCEQFEDGIFQPRQEPPLPPP